MEGGIAPGLLGHEIQKIPLRHEDEEPAMGRQMRKIRHRELLVPDPAP